MITQQINDFDRYKEWAEKEIARLRRELEEHDRAHHALVQKIVQLAKGIKDPEKPRPKLKGYPDPNPTGSDY